MCPWTTILDLGCGLIRIPDILKILNPPPHHHPIVPMAMDAHGEKLFELSCAHADKQINQHCKCRVTFSPGPNIMRITRGGGISTRVALVMTQRELAEDDSNVPNKAALQQHRRRSNCTRFVTWWNWHYVFCFLLYARLVADICI